MEKIFIMKNLIILLRNALICILAVMLFYNCNPDDTKLENQSRIIKQGKNGQHGANGEHGGNGSAGLLRGGNGGNGGDAVEASVDSTNK